MNSQKIWYQSLPARTQLIRNINGLKVAYLKYCQRPCGCNGTVNNCLVVKYMCLHVRVHGTVLLFTFLFLYVDGLSLLNEDGGLRVFFPRNSFVTNTTLTHTDSPRSITGGAVGNDHIVCYGGSTSPQVTWHNSGGEQLEACAAPCNDCGGRCIRNGAVGLDPRDGTHTDIHMYTDSPSYVNQDLECQVSSGQSAFIGVYLKEGGEFAW